MFVKKEVEISIGESVKDIPEAIRMVRTLQDLSQDDVYVRTGVSQNSISMYEGRKRSLSDVRLLKLLEGMDAKLIIKFEVEKEDIAMIGKEIKCEELIKLIAEGNKFELDEDICEDMRKEISNLEILRKQELSSLDLVLDICDRMGMRGKLLVNGKESMDITSIFKDEEEFICALKKKKPFLDEDVRLHVRQKELEDRLLKEFYDIPICKAYVHDISLVDNLKMLKKTSMIKKVKEFEGSEAWMDVRYEFNWRYNKCTSRIIIDIYSDNRQHIREVVEFGFRCTQSVNEDKINEFIGKVADYVKGLVQDFKLQNIQCKFFDEYEHSLYKLSCIIAEYSHNKERSSKSIEVRMRDSKVEAISLSAVENYVFGVYSDVIDINYWYYDASDSGYDPEHGAVIGCDIRFADELDDFIHSEIVVENVYSKCENIFITFQDMAVHGMNLVKRMLNGKYINAK